MNQNTNNHNGTKHSFLARGQLQITFRNRHNVTYTQALEHHSGYDRARNDDQRVVEQAKFLKSKLILDFPSNNRNKVTYLLALRHRPRLRLLDDLKKVKVIKKYLILNRRIATYLDLSNYWTWPPIEICGVPIVQGNNFVCTESREQLETIRTCTLIAPVL